MRSALRTLGFGAERRRPPFPFPTAIGYDPPMSEALPRPVLYVGVPVLAAAVVVAVWAWLHFGAGVWFDTIATGFAACL